jgi:hypothetical protein
MNVKDLAVPVTAGLAVAAGSSALAGVLQGSQWLGYSVAAVVLMVLTGLLARPVLRRWWAVVPVQLLVLLVLLTALFSSHPALGVLPGPSALRDLADQLSSLGHLFDDGVPPVPVTEPLLLLVCLAFGLLAIAVDALAVLGYGAAACGLALLCEYTVSTTLAPDALPNWTLVLGAVGFAALLVVEHYRRQTLSHPDTDRSDAEPGTDRTVTADPPDAGEESGPSRTRRRFGLPGGLAVTAISIAVALLVGVMATAVGTTGRFPGHGAEGDKQDVQFGLNPFTSLRGQLTKPEPKELLRVRGLPEATYLRALTLSEYVPSRGWQLPTHRYETALDNTLPTGLPQPLSAPTVGVEVDNVGYRDRWLPMAGLPLGVTGVTPGRWHYDVTTSTAYTSGPVSEPRWVERAMLQIPSAAMLNTVASTTDVDPSYLDTTGIDPRITQLTATITGRAGTQFGKVVALNKYFLDPINGFHYTLKTAPGSSGDALVDFLLRGRSGYCEQFASSMAVMLRTIGVPSRVAVGFTPGKDENGVRSIETSDAHAWVEAYFTGAGWLTFDPTPLGDGRGITPSYMAEVPGFPSSPPATPQTPPTGGQDDQSGGLTPQPTPEQSGGAPQPSQATPGQGQGGANPQDQGSQPNGDSGPGDEGGAGKSPDKKDDQPGKDDSGQGPMAAIWHAVLIGLLIAAIVIAVVAAPSTARRLVRRKRLSMAAEGGVAGAAAAWRELLAESRDRGGQPPGNCTVRAAARRMVTTHRLDQLSTSAVRAVVGAVERGWYAPASETATGTQLVEALRQIRTGLDSAAPMAILDRLWPPSVRPRLLGPRLPGRGLPGPGTLSDDSYADQGDPSVGSNPADRYAQTAPRR